MVPGDHLCFLRWDAWPFTCFHAVGAWPREASGATAPEWRLVEYAGQFTDPLTRETVRTHRALAIASGDRTLLIPANPIDKTIEGGVPLGASVWALLGAVTPRMLGIAVYGDSGEIGIVAVLEGSAEAEDVLAVSCMRWTILSDYVGVDVKISIVENVRPCDTGSHEPYGGMWVYGDSRSW
jgi:hypothetical protein